MVTKYNQRLKFSGNCFFCFPEQLHIGFSGAAAVVKYQQENVNIIHTERRTLKIEYNLDRS